MCVWKSSTTATEMLVFTQNLLYVLNIENCLKNHIEGKCEKKKKTSSKELECCNLQVNCKKYSLINWIVNCKIVTPD